MFLGEFQHSLDAKGRVILPARYRDQLAEGVAPRYRVVWWGPLALDAIELGYGVSKIGATQAPVNPNFTEAEAADAMQTLKPRLVVMASVPVGILFVTQVSYGALSRLLGARLLAWRRRRTGSTRRVPPAEEMFDPAEEIAAVSEISTALGWS